MKLLSTDKIDTFFPKHGEVFYQFEPEISTLYTYATGPFNEQVVISLEHLFFEKIAPQLKQFGEPYMEFVICKDSCMITPQAHEMHGRYLAKRHAQNVMPTECIALIINTEESLSLTRALWQPHYAENQHKLTVFDDVEKADAYLLSIVNS